MSDKKNTGKSYDEMNNTELLRELAKNQKRMRFDEYISLFVNFLLLAVLIFVVVYFLPKADGLVNTIKSIQELTESTQESMEGINEVVQKVNTIVEDNAESVKDALVNVNKIDFEELNRAITNLSQVIETSSQDIEDAISNFNKVDFSALNSGISKASDIMSTVNGVFGFLRDDKEDE